MKHTPAPWTIEHNWSGMAAIKGPDDQFITALAKRFKTLEEDQANARLIAAAPLLLEACEEALDYLGAFGKTPETAYNPLEASALRNLAAAIAAATKEE